MDEKNAVKASELLQQIRSILNICALTDAQSAQADAALDGLDALCAQKPEEAIDFKNVCDHLTCSVYLTDGRGKTLYVNQAYLDRSGLDLEDLMGYTISEIHQNDTFHCDINAQVMAKRQMSNAIAYIPKTNRKLYVTGVPIFDADGNVKYVLTNDRDVGELMEVENQLLQLKQERILDQKELEYYRSQDASCNILYASSAMNELMELVKRIAPTDVTVLITGESGTGKELMANAVFSQSSRRDKPYVKINCAAIPADLLESELFGYEEGAFTGARRGGKIGAFELANHGTLLLDEVGDLPIQVQAKLLRALQEREIVRIGGQKTIQLDIRVIAATNRNLREEVRAGIFREDLYYRLNVMPLTIPSLRERREDIPILAGAFIEQFCEKYKKSVALESGSMAVLSAYDWPGNIRELKNLMERLVVINTTGTISQGILRRNLGGAAEPIEGKKLKDAVVQLEKRMIQEALEQCGSKRKAAAMLGIDHSTLVKKCKQYGMDEP